METPRTPEPLTAEQEALVLAVLRSNHDYYQRQGMSRAHMWPEELLDEIRIALRDGQALDWGKHQGEAKAQP